MIEIHPGERVASPSLVGRHEELRVLRAMAARAAAGQASTVLVGGEAGIGKTRSGRSPSHWADSRGPGRPARLKSDRRDLKAELAAAAR